MALTYIESEIQGLKISKLQSEEHASAKIEQLDTEIATLEQSLKSTNATVEVSQGTSEMLQVLNRLLESKGNEIELLKQNTAHQLEKEKKKNDVLKRKIKLLMQGKNPQQTVVQYTVPFSNDTSSSNVVSSHSDLSDNP
jgi:predicted RNase H-like nuclease (RuvC/YqgF family)